MAGVNHNRQMAQLVQGADGGDIQRIAGVGFKGADTPLAENDLLVAFAHDILGAHEQFLQGVGKTTLEKNGLLDLAQLLQKVKILHISGTHLNDIHILKQGQVADVHDFRDDGKSRGLLCLQQQLDALTLHALEGIGGGTGLECATAQNVRAGCLDGCGNLDDLLLGLHRAGTCNDRKIAAANTNITHLDDGVVGMELSVCLLKGLGNPLDGLHNLQTLQ